MTLSLIELLVLFLACARVTRFVTTDTLSRPIRDWIVEKENTHRDISITTLITCSWCSGIWVSAAMIALTWPGWNWVWWVWIALAIAWVAGALGEYVGSE